MLKLQNVEAGYDTSKVLVGVNFEIQPRQVVSLIGRNGMGKSTTVKSIMGLLPIRSGDIMFEGKSLRGMSPNQIARLGIGLVPEGRRVFGSLTVEENLVATARPRSGGWDLARVYDLFPRLRERRQQSARTLSGGEQQMLAIARALLTNPRLLVLDEATEGLAPLIRQEIWKCLAQLKQEGQTILVIDKNLKEMARLVDRHHILEKGRVVWQGTPAELEGQQEITQRYLGV